MESRTKLRSVIFTTDIFAVCDSSLPTIRQIEFTMHFTMLNPNSVTSLRQSNWLQEMFFNVLKMETRAICMIYWDKTTSKNRAVNHEYEKEKIINQQASV